MAYEFQNIDYELSKIIDSQNEKIKIQNESDKTSTINETTENDINGLIPESSYAGQVQFDPQNKQLLLISDSDFLAIPIPIEEISLEKSLTFQDRLGFRRQIKGEFFFVFLFTKSKAVDCLRSFSKIKGEIENATFLKEKAEKKRLKVYDDIIRADPTECQKEMLEEAKKKNIIVFLETGRGKTFIAIMLLKEVFGEQMDRNANNQAEYKKKSTKVALFLFKTVSLLLQQSKVIKHNTNLKVRNLYGSSDINYKYMNFRKTLDKYDVICATPETMYRYFTFGYLTKEDLNLIVLDECHHCIGEDFYNRIMQHFILNKVSKTNEKGEKIDLPTPKILGLTASPTFNSNLQIDGIKKDIENLCNNMNCHIAYPKDLLKEEQEEKEPQFLTVTNELEQKQKMVKDYVFLNVVLPMLEEYLKPKYKEIISTYKTLGMIQPKKKKIPKEEMEQLPPPVDEVYDEGNEEEEENENNEAETVAETKSKSQEKDSNTNNKASLPSLTYELTQE